MKIVHTSDWHAGKALRGAQRLDELRAVLTHLSDYVRAEAVDLVLITGDIFDTGAPSAAAEAVVFDFLLAIHQIGARSVLIAGNHDSGPRVSAWGRLAQLAGVHALGVPRKPQDGGAVELRVGGETAVVACLPFASASTMASGLELTGVPRDGRLLYARRMQQVIETLCAGFRDDTVNLLLAHTNVTGAVFGCSERRIHLAEQWTIRPSDLPASAHYVALGHLHRPQWIEGAPAPARYAGAPLQMDFGEVGEDKSFTVIEAHPGQPAVIQELPYQGGWSLVNLEGTPEEIRCQAEALPEESWLRTTVTLSAQDPEIGRTIRDQLPKALVVRASVPDAPFTPAPAPPGSAVDRFRGYIQQAEDIPLSQALLDAFTELYEQESAASGGEVRP